MLARDCQRKPRIVAFGPIEAKDLDERANSNSKAEGENPWLSESQNRIAAFAAREDIGKLSVREGHSLDHLDKQPVELRPPMS
jgi:hypothetical protein